MSDSPAQPSSVRVVATTLTDLHVGPSFLTEMLTQVTNGVELEVLKFEGDWCHVRQRDGYTGWAHAPYLPEGIAARSVTHLVSDLTLLLRADGNSQSNIVTSLPIGTGVAVSQQRGEWRRVEMAGDAVPSGWARLDGLRDITQFPLTSSRAREQIVADARRLTGVYYLWGGSTAWGIDCSGLTQLCHRLAGYVLPRDANMQFPAGRTVEPPFKAGDLLFFHSETNREKITHVGISTGVGWRMIHSSRSRNGVYEEDLDSDACRKMRERFAGARSFLTL